MTALPPAVVLGGEAIAVAVARSLSPLGVRVHAVGDPGEPVQHSRHCHAFTELPAERWLDWLLTSAPEGAVVIPCADEALEIIARERTALEARGLRPIETDDEALLRTLDKEASYEIARRAGVSAPRTVVVTRPEEIDAALEVVGWPAAIKPLHSHVFARQYGILQKVFVEPDAAALKTRLEEVAGHGIEVMLTEIVPGPDDAFFSYYSYLDADGEPLLHVTKRKLRQYPPRFGLGSFHVTDWDERVAAAGLRWMQAAGVRGLACVEFKRDERTGELRFIECNHRLTLATEQLRRAGADLPRVVYDRAIGRTPPPVDGYRRGVTYWFPLRDLRAFRAYRRDGDLSTVAWLRSVARPHTLPLGSLSDPKPSLVGAAGTIRRALGRLTG